jgi:hypothetical protein
MKKHLLPSALILLLGLGFAMAQTITRAIQLSQDATGSFSVDTFLGVYFPGHILSPTGGTRPNPTIVGTGTPAVTGTDTAGTVTMGTSGQTATLTFGAAYGSVPACTVTWQSSVAAMSYTLATNIITLGQTTTSANKINYICLSAS